MLGLYIGISTLISAILIWIYREDISIFLENFRSLLIFKRNKKEIKEKFQEDLKPFKSIKKFCGFRDIDERCEVCTIFKLENNQPFYPTEEDCKMCPVWDEYLRWERTGGKKQICYFNPYIFGKQASGG